MKLADILLAANLMIEHGVAADKAIMVLKVQPIFGMNRTAATIQASDGKSTISLDSDGKWELSDMDNGGFFFLTDAQKNIVLKTSPGWMSDDLFCGDDNDLACIISRAGDAMASALGASAAAKMVIDNTPAGFITATFEELETHYKQFESKK